MKWFLLVMSTILGLSVINIIVGQTPIDEVGIIRLYGDGTEGGKIDFLISEQDTTEYIWSDEIVFDKSFHIEPPGSDVWMIVDYDGYIILGDSLIVIDMNNQGSVSYKDSTKLDEAATLFWKAISSVYNDSYRYGYNTTMWKNPNENYVSCPYCGSKIIVRNWQQEEK